MSQRCWHSGSIRDSKGPCCRWPRWIKRNSLELRLCIKHCS